jgi:tripartite-type tricarboxylate transporter receptor subunit TctC
MNMKRFAGTALAACLTLASAFALAEDPWPSRPVHIIVPFAPGSTPDIVARMVSDRLSERLGKPVIVENKPGAGGNIGTDAVAKANPDGYTLGLTISGPLAANTLLFKKLPYNPRTDIEPITIAATQPSVLVVSAQSGVKDVAGLLARLAGNPGKFNYSSMGTGTISHLAMAALAARTGTEIVHVPYAGSGQAVTAILAGDTQMAVLPAAAVMPHVQAGKLTALAVATAKRSTVLPELPTLAEAGLPDIQGDAWMGFIAPARTPGPIISRLQADIAQIVHSDDMRQKLHRQLMEPVGGTPTEFRATVQSDLARWQPVIRKNNISLD